MTDQSNDIVETTTTENTGVESQEIKEWGQEDVQETEQNQEGDEGKEEGQEPDKTEPEKPKKSRAQERIEQLARENAELKRKQAEFESKKDTQEIKRPKIEEFEDYSKYEDAMEEYHAAKAEQRVLEKLNKAESEKAQSQTQRELEATMYSFAEKHGDFDSVVQEALKRPYPMPVTLDEVSADFGYDSETQVRLLYELAKDDAFHKEVSDSSKMKAARLLSERVDSWSKEQKTTPPVSKAPKPIKPVQANAPATRDPSNMSDDEWYREQIKQRKGK